MARIAVIDLGTNSVRFDIHELAKSGNYKTLFREKLMVRLGQDVFTKGRLNNQAVQRTVLAFKAFHKVIQSLHVKRVVAFGTSALREASDAPRLINAIARETGIVLKVISGAEEARLISLGVLQNERLGTGQKKFALIDIGGGSTEISLCKKNKTYFSVSLPLGTARLQQIFLRRIPPSPESVQSLREEIRKSLKTALAASKVLHPPIATLIGSSGTVRALAKVLREREGGRTFKLRDLHKLNSRMATMSTGELISIPRMDLKRVDMILSGSILLEECAAVIGATKIVATEFSLRDGIMYEQSLGLSTATGASLLAHLDDIVAWAARFGVNEKESRKHLRNAALVFRSSKKMHRLSRHWEPYLLAAAVLRRTGELISSVDFGAHSAYIVEHAKFPFLEDWETRLIAHICRSSDPTGAKKFDRKQLRRLELPMECAPITGLLILCETLHLGGAPIGNFRVRGRGKKWYLHHPRLTAGGVEAVKLQQYSKLFKDAFEKKIEIG